MHSRGHFFFIVSGLSFIVLMYQFFRETSLFIRLDNVSRLQNPVPSYTARLQNSVPDYTWLRKSVTKLGFQLRMVTLVGYTTRFSVTHGYENSKKRCATQGSALPVTDLGYAFV